MLGLLEGPAAAKELAKDKSILKMAIINGHDEVAKKVITRLAQQGALETLNGVDDETGATAAHYCAMYNR